MQDFHSWWTTYYSKRHISIVICLDKLIKSRSSVQDTSKQSKGKHKLSVEITRFENFYCICYHPNCPIQTYREVVFALRGKIEKK